jgi:hypothetical protein
VRLGSTPLNVVSVMTNQIRFTVPALPSATGGHIIVETSGGTGTSPRAVNYNPAPSNLGLLRKDGPETSSTAPWVPVTDGRLERDRNYRISGNNLHFIVDGFPATDTVQSLTAPTNSVRAGQAVHVTVLLDNPATRSTVVTLTTANPALLSIPLSVPLAAGQTSVTFRAQAGAVPIVTSVWIDAKAGTSTRRLELRITP